MREREHSDPNVSREEFNRRLEVFDQRITTLERKNDALEKRLAQFLPADADPTDAYTPDPERLRVLSLIDELAMKGRPGASVKAVIDHASERNLLKSQTKIIVENLLSEGYLEGELDGRVEIVEWPAEIEK